MLLLALLPCAAGAVLVRADAADGDVFAYTSMNRATLHTSGQHGYGVSVYFEWAAHDAGADGPHVSVAVTRNTDGAVVYARDFGQDSVNGSSWRGRGANGKFVAPGNYTLTLTGAKPATTDADGNTVPALSEVRSVAVPVVDASICYGVEGCHVRPKADVNGDGVADQIALASRGDVADRSVILRVKTGAGHIVSVHPGAPYWYGTLWQGTARLDGRKGSEIVVGHTAGAHTQFYRALTWRSGTLKTLGAPGPGTDWVIDGAVGVSIGWQHRAVDPVGTIWKRSAVRTGDAVSSRFQGTLTKYRWTSTGWRTSASKTVRPLADKTAYSWGGFRVPGLPRW